MLLMVDTQDVDPVGDESIWHNNQVRNCNHLYNETLNRLIIAKARIFLRIQKNCIDVNLSPLVLTFAKANNLLYNNY